MLDIHQDQFLVLLLVVQAELHDCGELEGGSGDEEAFHGLVHRLAIGRDLHHTGPREKTAFASGVATTRGLVVRVEQVEITVVDRSVVGPLSDQRELLEEPGDVTAVPLGGTDIGHGLDRLILRGQTSRQCFGGGPNVAVTRQRRARCVARTLGRSFLVVLTCERNPARALSRQRQRKVSVGVLPLTRERETRRSQFALNADETELRRDLGTKLFAVVEVNRQPEARDDDVLFAERDEPHLNGVGLRVPAGHVRELLKIKVGAEVRVNDGKDVLLEGGGDTLGVVVSRHQANRILDEIRSEQEVLPVL